MNLFSKNRIIKILSINFKVKLVQDEEFGTLVEFSPREALRLLLCIESYILRDSIGDQLFGSFKTINDIGKYKIYNGGLFKFSDNSEKIKETRMCYLKKNYPNFFKKNKLIIFKDSDKSPSEEIGDVFKNLQTRGLNTEDYILVQVNTKGSNWEHIFEYFYSETYIKEGYIVDTQLPWNYYGTPDIGFYKIRGLKKGFLVNELPSLIYTDISLLKEIIPFLLKQPQLNEFTVGEVKTQSTKSQIIKYQETGYPTHFIEFVNSKKVLEENPANEMCLPIVKLKNNSLLQQEKFKYYSDWFFKIFKTLYIAKPYNRKTAKN